MRSEGEVWGRWREEKCVGESENNFVLLKPPQSPNLRILVSKYNLVSKF